LTANGASAEESEESATPLYPILSADHLFRIQDSRPAGEIASAIMEKIETIPGFEAKAKSRPIDPVTASQGAGRPEDWVRPGRSFFSMRRLALSAVWLLLIGTLSFLSLGFLKSKARSITEDTLPGLTYAGAANANLAQAFNRTLVLLMTDNPQEKARAIEEIEKFSDRTTALLVLYKNAIASKEDAALFADLLKQRTRYLEVRQKTLALAEQNQRQEAAAMCQTELLPAFYRYKEAGDRIFEYNMREGQARGEGILAVCTATQYLVAGIGISIFVAGFMIGLSRQWRPRPAKTVRGLLNTNQR